MAADRGLCAGRAGRWRKRKLAGHEDWLHAVLAAEPGITLAELQRRLGSEKAITISRQAINTTLKALGYSFKKTSRAAEQDRPDIIRKRRRSARGQRLNAALPFGHWKTTTFVAGLRLDGVHAPMVLDGAINGDAFRAYVEQVLGPCLRPGDIVVMDNLAAHKVAGVLQAIKARGAFLLYTQAGSKGTCGTNKIKTMWSSPRVRPRSGYKPSEPRRALRWSSATT